MSCPGSPAVTFVYTDWVALYPAFAGVTSGAAQGFFNTASLYCHNRLGPVPTVAELTTLLYLLTAHVAWLFSPRDGQGNPASAGTQVQSLVGRVSDATEGSVSVSTDNQYPPGTAQWYQQTPWGSAYWAAIALYRTMHYRQGRHRFQNPTMSPFIFPNGS